MPGEVLPNTISSELAKRKGIKGSGLFLKTPDPLYIPLRRAKGGGSVFKDSCPFSFLSSKRIPDNLTYVWHRMSDKIKTE